MRTHLIVLLIIGHFHFLGAQELPNVTLPNPEAASLFKYLNYPVDYSTGIPDISIPLYQVSAGELKVPITLKYHSSGRKVYDETGAIGLGWSLSAGGMISRTVYGERDDNDYIRKFPVPWKFQSDLNTATLEDSRFLEGVAGSVSMHPIPHYDTEYDYFSYSANGIAGKFVLRDVNNNKVPVLLPAKPYLVSFHQSNTQFNINYFDYLNIIDDKGVLYRFGKSIKTDADFYETSQGINGWMLTEIISSDKIDTVYFTYQSFSKSNKRVTQQTTIIDQQVDCVNRVNNDEQINYDNTGTISETNFSIQRLIEIKWRNGKVKFNLHQNSDLIASVSITDSKGTIVKSVELNQTTQDQLSDGNAPTRKLNSIDFKDQNNQSKEKYFLEYYPTIYALNSQSVDGRYRDLWGYYNASGAIDMRPLVEGIFVQGAALQAYILNIGSSTARVPNLEAAKSGVLKKITFPTGGTQEFFYEQNKYDDANTLGGGLRLSQMVTNPVDGDKIYKTYKYGANESGFGTIALRPTSSNMFVETRHQAYAFTNADRPSVYYRERTYHADVLPIFSEIHQRPIYYPQVTEYHGTPGNNIGKTVYTYDAALPSFPQSVQGLFSAMDYKYWKQTSIIATEDFKNVAGIYTRVKKTTNEYQETTYPDEKVWGLHVAKYVILTPHDLKNTSGETVYDYYPHNLDPPCVGGSGEIFRFSDYTISVGKKELVRTTEELFDDNDNPTIVGVIDYTYNNHHLISSVAKTSSTGDKFLEGKYYPFDFSESINQLMVSRNMLDYPIEIINYKNSNVLSGTKTIYKDWGGHIIKPETIWSKQASGSYEERVRFHSYNTSGNIQSVSKANDNILTYLWGYANSFPIAKVVNATNNESYGQGTSTKTISKQITTSSPETMIGSPFEIFANQSISPSVYVSVLGSIPPESPLLTVVLKKSDGTWVKDHFCTWGSNDLGSIALTPGIYQWYYFGGDIVFDEIFTGIELTISTESSAPVTAYKIFHTSFEDDGDANALARTGNKVWWGVYQIFLPADNGEYKLSYWKKNGMNPWELIQQNISISAGVVQPLNIGEAGAVIDEVRLYPARAQMVTYTYDPLIGMTSTTDANNVSTYYEYDDIGRLKYVKDSDKNIVRHHEYHYRGEQP